MVDFGQVGRNQPLRNLQLFFAPDVPIYRGNWKRFWIQKVSMLGYPGQEVIMRYWKYLAMLTVLMVPLAYSQAQVRVGIGVGPVGVAVGPAYAAGPPVCAYGYYDYYPYACAPYGYYGPDYFVDGVFIGVGPWYHWGHPAWFWNRGYVARSWDRDDWGHDRWGRGYARGGYGHEGYARGSYGRGYVGNGYARGGSYGYVGHGEVHAGGGFRGESHGGGGFHAGGGFHGGRGR
jgi:hypothetical protein